VPATAALVLPLPAGAASVDREEPLRSPLDVQQEPVLSVIVAVAERRFDDHNCAPIAAFRIVHTRRRKFPANALRFQSLHGLALS